jgi:hypothetical protein
LIGIQQRQVAADQLGLLAAWLDREPEAPVGRWFKRFPGMTVCGEGEWVKTFLTPNQVPVATSWCERILSEQWRSGQGRWERRPCHQRSPPNSQLAAPASA